MTAVAMVHPHTVRTTIVKAATATVLLAVTATGLYAGAGALTRHYTQPDTTTAVSYADQATIDRTLAGAWHTPAKQGAFRADANITGGNVRSVVVVVP